MMLRFASSFFQRRDKPKPKEMLVEPSGHGVPYGSGNSSTSSSTSFSVRTPTDSADLTVGSVSGNPVPKWKALFKGKKDASSSKSSPPSASPSTYLGARHVSPSTRFHQPSASFIDSEDEYLSPPVRPFVNTPESSRSASSSPRSSRSSLVGISAAHSNLQALILTSLQPAFSPHPFLYIPSEPIYPRSCNPLNSHPVAPSTLRHQVLRTRLLKRLETYTFTLAEERSVRPVNTSRPRRMPKAQFGLTEVEAMVKVDSGGLSRGLNRWIKRGGFEVRNAMWKQGKNGGLVMSSITGGPIAALEFSAGVEALGGVGDDRLHMQSIPPHSRGSHEDVNAAIIQAGSRVLSSSSFSSPPLSPRNMPSPTTPVIPKRGVRFASISSEGDTDPPILIVHPSTPAEELEIGSSPRLKVPLLETSKPNIEERRRALEQARRREEANERARRQGEAQRKLQEEVIAARLRRESFRLDGGSSSVRAWSDFGQKMDPLSNGAMAAATLRKPATRRSATDPEAMSLPRHRGSWASPPLQPFPESPLDPSLSRRGGAPPSPHFPNSSPRSLTSAAGPSRPHRASVTSATFVPSHLSPNSTAHSTSAQSDDPHLRKRHSLMPGDLSRTRLDDTRSIRSLTHSSRPLPSSPPALPTGIYPSYPTPPMGAPMVVMQPVYILPSQIPGSMFPWGSGPVPIGGTQGTMPLVPSQHAGAASPRPLESHRRSHPISGSSAPSTGTRRAPP